MRLDLMHVLAIGMTLSPVAGLGADIKKDKGLRLEVTPVQATDQRPAVRVALVNESSSADAIWVNKRMAENSAGEPPLVGRREITIQVHDDKGRAIPRWCKTNVPPAALSDYTLLHRGEFVGRTIPLDFCWDLRTPGRYRVTVSYKDSNVPSGLKPAAPHLDWVIVANAVEITVVSPAKK